MTVGVIEVTIIFVIIVGGEFNIGFHGSRIIEIGFFRKEQEFLLV